jgi:hypothetical protein
MDRRTKLILLVIGSLLLLGAVFWFVVWPLLSPVLPSRSPQPPALGDITPQGYDIEGQGTEPSGEPGTGQAGTGDFTFSPGSENPDVQRILDLSRRAGVLSERAESGSNANGFRNYEDAALEVSPALSQTFLNMQADLRAKYAADGPPYLTIARRLVEIPESEARITGDSFDVRVQMQVEIRDNGVSSVEYRESTVTFRLQGSKWVADGYRVETFTP